MVSAILRRVPKERKRQLRRLRDRWLLKWVRTFRSYGPAEFLDSLRSLGIEDGDTLMVHAGFRRSNGFLGTVEGLVDVMLEAVGATGNIMMVSLAYRGSTLAYLADLDCFDVRKAPSKMGLVSEYFRRRPGVLRSIHPSHPVLAYGPKARWLVEGHASCRYGCGPGSPFEKALQLDGKVLFFDVGFANLTFFHWLEHYVKDELALPLYHEPPFHVLVTDEQGRQRVVDAYAYSSEMTRRRRPLVLEREMRARGLIATKGLGNTMLRVVRLQDAVRCVDEMKRVGRFFYDVP